MKKLTEVQNKLKAKKSKYSDFGKYHYRSCEDILEAVKPLLLEAELTMTITDDIILIGDRYYLKATVKIIEADKYIEVSAMARETLSRATKSSNFLVSLSIRRYGSRSGLLTARFSFILMLHSDRRDSR